MALPDFGNPGTITAQKRNETTLDTVRNETTKSIFMHQYDSNLSSIRIILCFRVQGFVFVRSRITGAGMVYLGRAWGNDSRVVFANTYMDDIVVPEGWGDWGIPARDK